jgi:hypothetical protein
MKTITTKQIQRILEDHLQWLNNTGGERANLRGANLCGANLCGANLYEANLYGADLYEANLYEANLYETDLCGANLREANLCGADLSEANLYGANLREANLCGANLREANLCGADLRGADLSGANLYGADLREANLCGANLCGANLYGANLYETNLYEAKDLNYPIVCPEYGEFTAFKKCRDNVIVKLLIPADAKRSSATTRKCRASKAVVLEIFGADKAISQHANDFIYEVGKTIEPANPFCDNRWEECASGIHFFITRKEAENY